MAKCFNVAIGWFFRLLEIFCENNREKFLSGTDFSRLNMTQRKEYIKSAFETVSLDMLRTLEESTIPEYTRKLENNSISEKEKSDLEKFKKVLEITKVIKSGVETEKYDSSTSEKKGIRPTSDLMNCFLHNDSTPSMTYTGSGHGFYCFVCNQKKDTFSSGTVVDIFNLINLISEWRNNTTLKFTEQMSVAVSMFVNGTVVDNEEEHKDYIKYTKEMIRTMYSSYHQLVKIKNDPLGLQWLKTRGISEKTATRLGVMTQYPTTIAGNPSGRAFMVFINSNGGYVQRLFMEDKEKVARYSMEENIKWKNQSGYSIGVFNGQVVEHCKKFNQPLFICEGAFDCLTCEEMGYHAVAINGVGNFRDFYSKYIWDKDIKCICLSDFDGAGVELAKSMKDLKEIYVPELYFNNSNSFLTQYKDINECLVADRVLTHKELKKLEDCANEYFECR